MQLNKKPSTFQVRRFGPRVFEMRPGQVLEKGSVTEELLRSIAEEAEERVGQQTI